MSSFPFVSRWFPRRMCPAILPVGVLALSLAGVGCGDDAPKTGTDVGNVDAPPDQVDAGPGKPGKRDSGADGRVSPPMMPIPTIVDDDTPVLETLQVDECGADNVAGLSGDQIASLKAGGSADGMRWLYPYDGTVFPRGIGAPKLMWEGAGTQAVYVHIKAQYYEYEGCLKPDAEGVLTLPVSAWTGVETQTTGPKGPFTIELSVLDGTTVRGPISEKVIVAQATLKGSLYYNTYNSALGGGLGGTVERIKPGQPAEFFTRTAECTGCHSVSAN
ncbi:MAG: Flagellar hook-length control protein FliK, partial [Myxococcaceae bacterium]|nr:Flagellar hook-length control protein FliK [Myxococcaceae bacterium]